MPTNKAFHIDVSRSDFEMGLRAVEQELQAFLLSVESWAQEVGFVESSKLLEKFDECFRIGTNGT